MYLDQHEALLRSDDRAQDWFVIKTADLLLRMQGVEIAARPWLYPLAEYADTGLKARLSRWKQITQKQLPSIKSSWVRKMLSPCASYEEDFEVVALMYDKHLAQQLTSIIAIADKQKIAPEEAASGNNGFDSYWYKEAEKLQDMRRQMKSTPNFFVTIAPGE